MDNGERGFSASLWRATAPESPPLPALKGPVEADVVIIGAGFTGLSAALHLQLMQQHTVVLEARQVGWGASGRNGGQVNPGWYLLPSEIRKLYGSERGQRVVDYINGSCDLVFALVKRYQIPCSLRRAPFFRAAYGHRGLRQVQQWTDEWSAVGAPVELIDSAGCEEILGSGYFHGGAEDQRGGSLQPLAYAIGLANAARQEGAQIYGSSLAHSIRDMGEEWLVTTQQGSVRARYLIIASNGYTDSLWPGLRRQVVPVVSRQTATAPLAPDLLNRILPFGHHVADTRFGTVYFRVDSSGRFQIGGRGNPLSTRDQYGDTRHLRAEAVRIFPELAPINWEFDWGGLVAITPNHAPQLLELAPRAFSGLGYNGRGIAMGTLMGQQLADRVLGTDTAMPVQPLTPIPFHRFRNLGVAWHIYSGYLRDRMTALHYHLWYGGQDRPR